ncbi:MAG: gp58-like family protein [Oscillospiraceae bacterium]|nr:gp58-like family protein [Oscillospiraceae bacterium]
MGKQDKPQKQKIKLAEVQSTAWDDNLTTTQNIVPDVQHATEAIYKVFNDLEQKRVEHAQIRKYDETEFSATEKNIQKEYDDKISKLNAEYFMLQQKTEKEHADKMSSLNFRHSKDQQDIQIQYSNKTSELEDQYYAITGGIDNRYSCEIDKIKRKRQDAMSVVQTRHKKTSKDLNDISKRLSKLEAEIPYNIKIDYHKKGSYSPIEPEFMSLYNHLNKAKILCRCPKMLFWMIWLIPSLIGQSILLDLWGAIAWSIIPVSFAMGLITSFIVSRISRTKKNDIRDNLMDKIEAGKTYIDSNKKSSTALLESTVNTADKDYVTAEADIERSYAPQKIDAKRNYEVSKADIEKKLPRQRLPRITMLPKMILIKSSLRQGSRQSKITMLPKLILTEIFPPTKTRLIKKENQEWPLLTWISKN